MLTQHQINVDLFNEVEKLQRQINSLSAKLKEKRSEKQKPAPETSKHAVVDDETLYNTPARRLRVDIAEGTIFNTTSAAGDDVFPSMKEDLIAILDENDALKQALHKLDNIYRQGLDEPCARPDWLQKHFDYDY